MNYGSGGYALLADSAEPELELKLPEILILELVRCPDESAEASLHDWVKQGLGQAEAVMIPSSTFRFSYKDNRWIQSWGLPSSTQKGYAGSQGIAKWLTSLSAKDTIILRPAQSFFANDVALYEGFGLKIYSAWI
jgi:hypothetical protein